MFSECSSHTKNFHKRIIWRLGVRYNDTNKTDNRPRRGRHRVTNIRQCIQVRRQHQHNRSNPCDWESTADYTGILCLKGTTNTDNSWVHRVQQTRQAFRWRTIWRLVVWYKCKYWKKYNSRYYEEKYRHNNLFNNIKQTKSVVSTFCFQQTI